MRRSMTVQGGWKRRGIIFFFGQVGEVAEECTASTSPASPPTAFLSPNSPSRPQSAYTEVLARARLDRRSQATPRPRPMGRNRSIATQRYSVSSAWYAPVRAGQLCFPHKAAEISIFRELFARKIQFPVRRTGHRWHAGDLAPDGRGRTFSCRRKREGVKSPSMLIGVPAGGRHVEQY
jgi:hypothetical protein